MGRREWGRRIWASGNGGRNERRGIKKCRSIEMQGRLEGFAKRGEHCQMRWENES